MAPPGRRAGPCHPTLGPGGEDLQVLVTALIPTESILVVPQTACLLFTDKAAPHLSKVPLRQDMELKVGVLWPLYQVWVRN
jgi:hypothetical protein